MKVRAGAGAGVRDWARARVRVRVRVGEEGSPATYGVVHGGVDATSPGREVLGEVCVEGYMR